MEGMAAAAGSQASERLMGAIAPLLPHADVLAAASPPPAVSLEQLPDEILAAVIQPLALDDYHMLTIPLISRAFQRSCELPAVEATRLASRLRQVAHAVVLLPPQPHAGSAGEPPPEDWAIGHAWGALKATERYLRGGAAGEQLNHLAAAPDGLESLRALVVHCAALTPPSMPSPPEVGAERLFQQAQAELARARQPAAVGAAPSCAQRADDKALWDVAAALNLQAGRGHTMVNEELQRQERRHQAAATRRRWKLLPPSERRAWERRAAADAQRALRRHEAVREVAALAAGLRACIVQALPLLGERRVVQPGGGAPDGSG